MKHLNENKLIVFLALAFLVIVSVGCNKEEFTLDGQNSGRTIALQSKNTAIEAVQLKAEEEMAAVKQSEQEATAYRQARQEELADQLDRRQAFRRNQVSTRSDQPVINVPGDFSTLQEAIDAAQPGTTIHLTGVVTDEYVFVDVPGLTIQAAEPLEATLNAQYISIIAPDVEVKNLYLVLESGISLYGTNGISIMNNVIESQYGVYISGVTGGTIKNNQIKGTFPGQLFLSAANDNNFADNQIEGAEATGNLVILADSNNNQFSNCSIDGLSSFFRGIILFNSSHNNFKECSVKGVLLTNFFASENSTANQFKSCRAENGNFGFFAWLGSNDNTYKDCIAEDQNNSGFLFQNTTGTKVSNCQATNSQNVGIFFYGGNNILLEKSSATGCLYGLSLTLCENSTAKGNEASGNFFQGFNLDQINGCLVSDNIVSDNSEIGISLEYSDNNTLTKNTAQNNGYCDFQLLGDIANNTLSKNSFGSECD